MTAPRARHPLADGLPEPWAVRWGEDEFGAFVSFAVEKVVQRMRWVPPGKFVMGSPETEAGHWSDEGPQHEVEIRHGYWIADTPVTQALWQAVMGENPSHFKGPERPVEHVSWEDCQRFCTRLNDLVPGLGARLPTEAEWEHACRATTATATWVGDLRIQDGRAPELEAIAWYRANSGGETRPVRQKLPNPLGLHDMLGNVHEWCQDWFGPYDAAPAIDSRGPRTGSIRVFRGGSWDSDAWYVRAADRLAHHPGNRGDGLGFRLARGQGGQATGPGAEPLAAGARSRRT